tara:strand:+ start:17270 stop:17506 length:237 start_codon:yes stop_codon:yes gene_type:complete
VKYTLTGFFLFLTVFVQAVIPGAQDMADDGEGTAGRQGAVNFPQCVEGPGVQPHVPYRTPQEQELIRRALYFIGGCTR